MKKTRKPRKPELRVNIAGDVMKALKLAVARGGDVSTAEVVEAALCSYGMVKREMESA